MGSVDKELEQCNNHLRARGRRRIIQVSGFQLASSRSPNMALSMGSLRGQAAPAKVIPTPVLACRVAASASCRCAGPTSQSVEPALAAIAAIGQNRSPACMWQFGVLQPAGVHRDIDGSAPVTLPTRTICSATGARPDGRLLAITLLHQQLPVPGTGLHRDLRVTDRQPIRSTYLVITGSYCTSSKQARSISTPFYISLQGSSDTVAESDLTS